jgi:hypothetical protein
VLPEAHLRALRTLASRLRDQPVEWALTGSAALAVHGLDVTCADLDVQTDAEGAVQIAELFADAAGDAYRIDTPTLRAGARRLQLDGVEVELLWDVHAPDPERRGGWIPSSPGSGVTRVDVGAATPVPVLSLPRLLEVYEGLGRQAAVQRIRAALRQG